MTGRRAARRPMRSVAVLVAAAALCGCGSTTTGVAETGAGGLDRAAIWPACAAEDDPAGDLGAPQSLPEDAVVVAVRRCLVERQLVPGDGEWQVRRVERAARPAAKMLLLALRLPSQPPSNLACTAEGVLPMVLDVETADGRLLRVLPPHDGCGATRPEVAQAYRQVEWTVVSTHRDKQVRSEAAVSAGCDAWKDMLALEATPQRGPGTRGGAPALPPGRPLRLCLYRAEYPDGWKPGDMTVVDGVPMSGTTLSEQAGTSVAEAVNDAGPAATCTQQHSRFAVLTATDGATPMVEPTYVELDGCLRILAGDGTLRQGTPDLVATLTAAAAAS